VVVFLVVVVVPVMGFFDVDSVTRAFCVVFLPARRERRLGFLVVAVVGAVVVRVRAMMSEELWICLVCVFVVSRFRCGAKERKREV
jgi:hypothetical protein